MSTAFVGGDAMSKYLADLSSKMKGQVDIGFMSDATYGGSENNLPVAQVAFWNEFGTASAPPRPFFRSMIAKDSPKWGGMIARGIKADLSGRELLENMGEEVAGALQQSIRDTNAPALSPVTLMLRKMKKGDRFQKINGAMVGEAAARVKAGESYDGVSTKPLIDTSQMLDAVTYKVRE